MSQTAAVQPLPQSIKAGQVLISGRLKSRRRFSTQEGPRFENIVTMPAPDAYSSPSTVSIVSKAPVGDPDTDVRVMCQVGGRSRSYKAVDPDTGEQKTVFTADNRLLAVE